MRPARTLAKKGNIPVGYYKDEKKTAETFRTINGVRYAIPGDYAQVEEDGTVTMLGRGSVSINSGGEKVYPEEVEAALKGHPDVFDALVVGVPDPRYGQQVAAVVQARPGCRPSLAELDSFVRSEIAGYKSAAQSVVCRRGEAFAGADALARAEGLTGGDILLLENIRFDKRETSKNDDDRRALAKQLVELVGTGGVFVSDGFGVVHRKQASVYDIATLLPHYAGTLVADEMRVLEQLTSSTQRPYAVVLGGSKVSDKLGVIESLATKADSIVIGGGMCFTFLAAQGFSVGTSLLEDDMIEVCRGLLETYHDVLRLPVDLVVTEKFAADSPPQTVDVGAVPNGLMGLDIGPGSIKRFSTLLSNAGTIFWNGPMGVFEFPAYAAGTRGVAEAIVAATGKGAFSVVGGGDSAAAVRAMNIPEGAFSHISTGGGASLEYLEGKTLPGIEVLSREQPTGGVL